MATPLLDEALWAVLDLLLPPEPADIKVTCAHPGLHDLYLDSG
jgi:hypothetical protein